MTDDTAAKPVRPQAERLALGSWHVFSRLTLDEGAELVNAALERGIRHFDIGDYWDHQLVNTSRFREIMGILGLPRERYDLSIKLFTNSAETREEVLLRTLDLLGTDYVDSVNCSRPNPSETLEQACDAMHGLVEKGLSRALAVGLWNAPLLGEAWDLMRAKGQAAIQFVQFQYNICRRDVVESEEFAALFARTGLGLQAAFTLEGGILAGNVNRRRYGPDEQARGEWFSPEERNIARDSGDIRDRIIAVVPELKQAADRFGVSPAQLAMAFAATHPALDTLLFGATRVWQIDEALAALELARTQGDAVREAVAPLRIDGAAAPVLFDFSRGIH